MDYYKRGLQNFFTFYGRDTRRQFWMFYLWVVMAGIVAAVLDSILGTGNFEGGLLSFIVGLIHFLPSLAAIVRRLHDTGRSGWWILIIALPLLGAIILLILCCLRGTPGANRFGPDPLGPATAGRDGLPHDPTDRSGIAVGPADDRLTQLEMLQQQRASGTISEAEFETRKAELLGNLT